MNTSDTMEPIYEYLLNLEFERSRILQCKLVYDMGMTTQSNLRQTTRTCTEWIPGVPDHSLYSIYYIHVHNAQSVSNHIKIKVGVCVIPRQKSHWVTSYLIMTFGPHRGLHADGRWAFSRVDTVYIYGWSIAREYSTFVLGRRRLSSVEASCAAAEACAKIISGSMSSGIASNWLKTPTKLHEYNVEIPQKVWFQCHTSLCYNSHSTFMPEVKDAEWTRKSTPPVLFISLPIRTNSNEENLTITGSHVTPYKYLVFHHMIMAK